MNRLFLAFATIAFSAVPAFAGDGKLLTPFGMAISAGGGSGGFTSSTMTDLTDPAGMWGARLTFGTRAVVGFDATYLGGLQAIDALGLDVDAMLLSTAVQGDVRFNFLRPFSHSPLQPFLFIGAAWKHYDVTNANVNLSSVGDADALFEMPMGGGFFYTVKRFIIDIRGSYNPAWNADLVRSAEEGSGMATWTANLQLGYEF
jgi:hypothetical protein